MDETLRRFPLHVKLFLSLGSCRTVGHWGEFEFFTFMMCLIISTGGLSVLHIMILYDFDPGIHLNLYN